MSLSVKKRNVLKIIVISKRSVRLTTTGDGQNACFGVDIIYEKNVPLSLIPVAIHGKMTKLLFYSQQLVVLCHAVGTAQ